MGKTDKEKAKEKEKSKAKAMMKDKVPKALRTGGDVKRKKWSKSKQKEKLNNQVYWTKPLHDKLLKDIIHKETYVTPSKISDKLKVTMSLAREALKELREQEQIVPSIEYHSRFCCFVKGPKYKAPAVEEKKKEHKEEKKGKKK
jgi:small subunit ribosomal protein S25e